MDCVPLLVDGHGKATGTPLRVRTLREFPGLTGLSVHFRPVRSARGFRVMLSYEEDPLPGTATLGVCCWKSRMVLTPNKILKLKTAHGR